MSTKPGVTTRPEASISRTPRPIASSGPTAVIVEPSIATDCPSIGAPPPPSTRRPLRITRSCIQPSSPAAGGGTSSLGLDWLGPATPSRPSEMDLGLLTLGDHRPDPATGQRTTQAERHDQILEYLDFAAPAGFGSVIVGEHHFQRLHRVGCPRCSWRGSPLVIPPSVWPPG